MDSLTPRQRAQKAVRLRELAELLSMGLRLVGTPEDAAQLLTDDETLLRTDPAEPGRTIAVAIRDVIDLDECGPWELHAVTELIRRVTERCGDL